MEKDEDSREKEFFVMVHNPSIHDLNFFEISVPEYFEKKDIKVF